MGHAPHRLHPVRARSLPRNAAAAVVALTALLASCSGAANDKTADIGNAGTGSDTTPRSSVVATPTKPIAKPPSGPTATQTGTDPSRNPPANPTLATASLPIPGPPSIPPLDPPAADTIPPFANPDRVPRSDAAATTDRDGIPMFPLTGLPAATAQAANAPVLAVKIDNAAAARPQTGLDRADVIIEEVVEGGVTRFLALFQSKGSDPVGPIRSVRPVDPALLTPFGGGFGYSGGTKRFINTLRRAPIVDVGVDLVPGAYFRGTQAKAPYNLYSSTSKLRAAMADARGPESPWELLDDAALWDARGASASETYDLTISPVTKVRWRWDATASLWERTTNGTRHVVRGGAAVTATNVVVIHVPYLDTTATDASHAPVPEPAVLGAGRATFLVGGMRAEGAWSKSSVGAPFRFSDDAGASVRLGRGVTWLLLAPAT